MDARKWIVLLTALLYIHSALAQNEDSPKSVDDAANGNMAETDEEILADKQDPDEDGGIVDEDAKTVVEEAGKTQEEKQTEDEDAQAEDEDAQNEDEDVQNEDEEDAQPENNGDDTVPENEEESKLENAEETVPENEEQPKADEVIADTADDTKPDAENQEPVTADENDESKKPYEPHEVSLKNNVEQPQSEDDSVKSVIPLMGRKKTDNGCLVNSAENRVNVTCIHSELKSLPIDIDANAFYLNLDDNLLPDLSAETFEPKLESLKILSVKNNQIKTVKKSIFEKIPNVEVVDLSKNPLILLNTNTFSTAEGNLIKEISFSDCSLNDISSGVFDDLFNLEILDIGKNSLNIDKDSLKELLAKLTALKTLTLPESYQSDDELLTEMCKAHDTMTVICFDTCVNDYGHHCQTAQNTLSEVNETLYLDEQDVLNEKPTSESSEEMPGLSPKQSTSTTRSVNGSAIGIIIGIVIVIAAGIIIKKNWGTLKQKWNSRGRPYPERNERKSGGPPLPRSPIPQEEMPLRTESKDEDYSIEINTTKPEVKHTTNEEIIDKVEQKFESDDEFSGVVVMENGNYGNISDVTPGYEVEMRDMRDIDKKPRIMSDSRAAFFNGMKGDTVTITEIKDTMADPKP